MNELDGSHTEWLHAARLMENRPLQISVLPVIDGDNKCLGLLRLHDLHSHDNAFGQF